MNVLSSSIASVFPRTGNRGGDGGDEDGSSMASVFPRTVLGFRLVLFFSFRVGIDKEVFAMLVKCCYGMK
jgi:hypothetical protein